MQQAHDLRAEGAELHELVRVLDRDAWQRPTPFKNWTVNDVIAHLHTTDRVAHLALTDPDEFRTMARRREPAISSRGSASARFELPEGPELGECWHSYLGELCDLLAGVDPRARIPWFGPDMSARMFATARQMETWAHGQDVYDLLKKPRTNTDRIKNIAVIGVRTFGWTFANRGLDVPPSVPYVRLTAPSGAIWEWGEPEAADRVEGSAVEFCHVVTQGRNIADTSLSVTGETASPGWPSRSASRAAPKCHPRRDRGIGRLIKVRQSPASDRRSSLRSRSRAEYRNPALDSPTRLGPRTTRRLADRPSSR